jgi:hypothetical protein
MASRGGARWRPCLCLCLCVCVSMSVYVSVYVYVYVCVCVCVWCLLQVFTAATARAGLISVLHCIPTMHKHPTCKEEQLASAMRTAASAGGGSSSA